MMAMLRTGSPSITPRDKSALLTSVLPELLVRLGGTNTRIAQQAKNTILEVAADPRLNLSAQARVFVKPMKAWNNAR